MITTFRRVACAASLLALLVPATASAAPGRRSVQMTFPHAYRLCTAVPLPKSLTGEQAQVTAACNALQSAYNAAVSTGQTAVAGYKQAVYTDRTAIRQACQRPFADKTARKACHQARRNERHAIRSERHGLRLALKQFRVSIDQARVTFWTTIHGLRGGGQIPADSPQPNAPLPSS